MLIRFRQPPRRSSACEFLIRLRLISALVRPIASNVLASLSQVSEACSRAAAPRLARCFHQHDELLGFGNRRRGPGARDRPGARPAGSAHGARRRRKWTCREQLAWSHRGQSCPACLARTCRSAAFWADSCSSQRGFLPPRHFLLRLQALLLEGGKLFGCLAAAARPPVKRSHRPATPTIQLLSFARRMVQTSALTRTRQKRAPISA